MSFSVPAIEKVEEMLTPPDQAEVRAEGPEKPEVAPAAAPLDDGYDLTEVRKTAYGKLVVAPFAAQWSWEGRSGKYYAFPADANTEIEAQYYERQLDSGLEGMLAEITSGDRIYRIDFEENTQENTATGRKRPIVRELLTAQWYWSGRAGEKWYPFAENDNQLVEACFQKWSFCEGTARFSMPTVRDTYHIDLEQMIQYNASTGRVREIKRVLGGAEDLVTNTAALGKAGYACEKTRSGLRPWNLTLKVTGEKLQCRRLSCSIPPYADGAAAVPIVRNVVENGFQDLLGAGKSFSVWYEDEDGDKCELVSDTWKDCTRHVSKGDVLKLSIALSGDAAGTSASTSASSLTALDAPAGDSCEEAMQVASPDEEECEGEEDVWAIV